MGTDKFEAGLEIRKQVLGTEYVERSLANATPFDQPIQELSTDYCWGHVWARPGLERKIRSLINLAMISALNRPDELALHVRGAINNGCTAEEISEVFLQVAVYCGIPAALESFRVGKRILSEMNSDD